MNSLLFSRTSSGEDTSSEPLFLHFNSSNIFLIVVVLIVMLCSKIIKYVEIRVAC